jgi:cytochrome c556
LAQHRRFRVGLMLLAAALAGGCDAASPYRNAFRDQTRALEELAKTLSTVTDKASMRSARTQLDARFDSFESVSQRAKKLPEPTLEILRQVHEELEMFRQALQKYKEHVDRINALPEGPEFIGSFEHIKGFPRDQVP